MLTPSFHFVRLRFIVPVAAMLLLLACGDTTRGAADGAVDTDATVGMDASMADATADVAAPTGLALLGNGAHTRDAVVLDVIADNTSGIRGSRDLAFNPSVPGQLWVTNHPESAMVVLTDVGAPTQDWTRRTGGGGAHFFAKPAALAFGAAGTLATVQEEDGVTQPSTPADFMGPTLWSSDLAIFDAGHASHLDMLHNSPNSAGIAWEQDNSYWVFDGSHSSLSRYAFNMDHGPGGADHSDGEVARYAEGGVAHVPGISAHLEFEMATGLLYVADTGNGRVAVLDPSTATRGTALTPNYDGIVQFNMVGASLTTLVDGAEIGMTRPSGLALRDGMVFVADNLSSRVFAFDTETGELIDWVDLSSEVAAGGLMGIEFGPEGNLYFVDSLASRVVRLSPLGS